jgi:hypothetical protein
MKIATAPRSRGVESFLRIDERPAEDSQEIDAGQNFDEEIPVVARSLQKKSADA